MIIGRMRVEPGSTPFWDGGDRGGYKRSLLSRMLNQGMGMGRNYLGDRPINMPEYAEEEIKGDIRRNIEQDILIKFQNDRNYTEAEKQSIEMTIAAQAGVHSGVIFKEACHRVSRNTNLQHDLEEMEDSQVAQIYYDEVLREALAIVDNEFEFQPNLNIEAFAKREARVKKQIENGDITMEEAQEILKKPIRVREETKQQEDKQENKQEKGYEQAYEGERQRQKTKKKKKYRGKNKGRNNRNRTNQTQARNGEDGQERSTEERKTGGNRAAEFRRAQTKYNRQPKPKQTKQTSPRSPEKNDKETPKNAQEEMEP